MWAKARAGTSITAAATAIAITKVPRRCLAVLALIAPPLPGSNQMWPSCESRPTPRVAVAETRPEPESCGLEPECLGDDAALDLGGAAVDRGDEGLAHQALHVVFRGVAVAAHHLHALEGDALGGLGDEELHHRGLLREHAILILVDHARDPVGHQLGRLEIRGEVREAMLE